MSAPAQDQWAAYERKQAHESKLHREIDKHPYVTGAATVGAVAAGVRGHGDVQAIRTLRHLKDPERAAKLAHELAPHRSAHLHLGDITSPADLIGTRLEQGKIRRAAVRSNRDIGPLKATVNRYSRTFGQAGAIKGAAAHPVSSPGQALRHPLRAERGLHARVLGGLVESAKHGEHPHLYRSQHNVGRHQVGDTVDFGRFSSFSSDQQVAHRTGAVVGQGSAQLHEVPKVLQHGPFKPPAAKGTTPVIYHLPAGKGQAVNLSGATNRFAQNEWMVGGKYKVARVEGNHVHLAPHSDVGKAWVKQGSGYTKKDAPPGRGGHVEDPGQYEALRRKGLPKRIAAAVSNTPHQVHRKDIFKGAPMISKASVYSASAQGAVAQEHANERSRARAKSLSSLAAANLIGTSAVLGHERLKSRPMTGGANLAEGHAEAVRRYKQLKGIRRGGLMGTAAALGAAGAYAGQARHHHKEAAAAARNVENLKQNPPPIFGKSNAFGVDEELVMSYQAPIAKLATAERAKIPTKEFGLPGKAKGTEAKKQSGNYPIDTRKRARAALSYSARFASPAQRAQIRSRVHAKYPTIGKAFDSEQQRHRRRAAYEGAAAGGSVAGAAGAGALGYRASRRFGEAGAKRGEAIAEFQAGKKALKGTGHREGARYFKPEYYQGKAQAATEALGRSEEAGVKAGQLLTQARRLRTGSKAAGLASVGLAGTAYGLHRHSAGKGRSYSNYGYR